MLRKIILAIMFAYLFFSLAYADQNNPKISDSKIQSQLSKSKPVSKVSSLTQSKSQKGQVNKQKDTSIPTDSEQIDTDTPAQTDSNQADSKRENQTTKHVIIFLLLISCISVFLHLKGKLILYRDYTDAAVTIGGVIGALIILFICKILGVSEGASKVISLLFFIGIFIFVFRMTFITNSNMLFAIFSLLTKYTTTFLYVILMIGLMFSGTSRKKDESAVAYELRRQREEAQRKVWMVAITALFVWFVNVTTKFKGWSPMGDYFSLSFKRLDLAKVNSVSNDERLASEYSQD